MNTHTLKKTVDNTTVALVFVTLAFGLLLGFCAGKKSAHHSMGHNSYMVKGYGRGGMHTSMKGMQLDSLKGEEMEKMFLKQMIVHHEGAVTMAEALLKETTRPELVTLGQDIIVAQNAEIKMMKGWLEEWFEKE